MDSRQSLLQRHVSALRALVLSLASLPLCSIAAAQVSFPETEPNTNKSEANSAGGMTAGDTITGVTTGTITTAGSLLITSVDNFRVRTAALPLGIYRHSLTITSPTVGHTGTLRGLNQTGTVGVGGTAGTTDVPMQASSVTTVPPRFNAWYGFGKQEEVYYRVEGAAATTGTYTSTLSTTPILPVVVGTPFLPGPITVTTIAQGHTTDTDMWLYDKNYNAVVTAGNDDEGPGGPTFQSRFIRTLPPGTYYLALSTFNLANNQVAPADDDTFQNLLDFPNIVASNSPSIAVTPLNVLITDGFSPTPVVIARSSPYEIVWICFTVTPTSTVLAGADMFVSPSGGTTADFAPTPLPAGFFGPGSDPFTGIITLGGSPLVGVGLAGGTDTIVKRPFNTSLPGCPGAGGVPIEIVALSLVSVAPIPVSFNGGTSTSIYGANAWLTNLQPQQQGNMQIRRDSLSGGTFDTFLPVQPRFTFTKISGVNGLPTLGLDPAPTIFLQALNEPWSHDDGGLGVPLMPGGLVDHDGNPGTPNVPFPPMSNYLPGIVKAGGDCFTNGGSPRRATIVHMAPNHTHTVVPPQAPPPPVCTVFCFGDGTGSVCPCLNLSIVGDDKGCLNATGVGGKLRCTGTASITNDTFVLNGSNCIPFGPGLYYQGSTSAPAGVVFGNGKNCMTGATPRLEIRFCDNTGTSATTVPIHILGSVIAPGLRNYQLWYRDGATFCTLAGFNFTNALSVTWVP